MRSNEWANAPEMNQKRYGHSQCAIGDFLYVFFGRQGMFADTAINTIETINAKNVVNRII